MERGKQGAKFENLSRHAYYRTSIMYKKFILYNIMLNHKNREAYFNDLWLTIIVLRN